MGRGVCAKAVLGRVPDAAAGRRRELPQGGSRGGAEGAGTTSHAGPKGCKATIRGAVPGVGGQCPLLTSAKKVQGLCSVCSASRRRTVRLIGCVTSGHLHHLSASVSLLVKWERSSNNSLYSRVKQGIQPGDGCETKPFFSQLQTGRPAVSSLSLHSSTNELHGF